MISTHAQCRHMQGPMLVQKQHSTGLEPAHRAQNTMLERYIAMLQCHITNNMSPKNAEMLETIDPSFDYVK